MATEYYCIAFGGGETGALPLNTGNAIALDSSHAAYVAGDTWSIDFPTTKYFSTTLNPLQKASGGGQDAFVVKVDPYGFLNEGYSTYLGGSGDDSANGIAVDSTGHAYVTGVTSSTNFPTNGAPSIGFPGGGGTTAFVTKLSKDGSRSKFSLYLGGTADAYHVAPFDQGNAIALNATNEIYVTGWTCSQNFPVTYAGAQTAQPTNCFISQQTVLNMSAFVVKLSNQGTMLFATYLGGNGGAAHGTSIAVNKAQQVYVAGDTSTSYGFPLAPQMALNPTASFLTKFSPDLHTVRSTTFLGALITGIVVRQTASSSCNKAPPSTLLVPGRYRIRRKVERSGIDCGWSDRKCSNRNGSGSTRSDSTGSGSHRSNRKQAGHTDRAVKIECFFRPALAKHAMAGQFFFTDSRPSGWAGRPSLRRQIKKGKPKLPLIHSNRNYSAVHTDFTSVYSSSASWPISRPHPDCL